MDKPAPRLVLHTPKEVADMFRVSYRKVLDLIALGELEAYRIGGSFRISQGEINRFLGEHKVESFWSIRRQQN